MVLTNVTDMEIYKKRTLNTNSVIIGIVFDEYYRPDLNKENPYYVKTEVIRELIPFL